MKYRWSPNYYSKKEIVMMENHRLIAAFEDCIRDEVKAQNFTKNGITQKQVKQHEWIRDELMSRLK